MGKDIAVGIGRAAFEPLMRKVRGRKVLLDRDAAEYFEVSLKALKAAVKRNPERFTADFMIMLNDGEGADREQLGAARGFTDVGVDMLSMVLKSHRAALHSVEHIREVVATFRRFGRRIF